MMTKDARLMGAFVNPLWLTWLTAAITAIIIALNVTLLWNFFFA
jgi:Mn2+/Fe2+ NRAMP family transporter